VSPLGPVMRAVKMVGGSEYRAWRRARGTRASRPPAKPRSAVPRGARRAMDSGPIPRADALRRDEGTLRRVTIAAAAATPESARQRATAAETAVWMGTGAARASSGRGCAPRRCPGPGPGAGVRAGVEKRSRASGSDGLRMWSAVRSGEQVRDHDGLTGPAAVDAVKWRARWRRLTVS